MTLELGTAFIHFQLLVVFIFNDELFSRGDFYYGEKKIKTSKS